MYKEPIFIIHLFKSNCFKTSISGKQIQTLKWLIDMQDLKSKCIKHIFLTQYMILIIYHSKRTLLVYVSNKFCSLFCCAPHAAEVSTVTGIRGPVLSSPHSHSRPSAGQSPASGLATDQHWASNQLEVWLRQELRE